MEQLSSALIASAAEQGVSLDSQALFVSRFGKDGFGYLDWSEIGRLAGALNLNCFAFEIDPAVMGDFARLLHTRLDFGPEQIEQAAFMVSKVAESSHSHPERLLRAFFQVVPTIETRKEHSQQLVQDFFVFAASGASSRGEVKTAVTIFNKLGEPGHPIANAYLEATRTGGSFIDVLRRIAADVDRLSGSDDLPPGSVTEPK